MSSIVVTGSTLRRPSAPPRGGRPVARALAVVAPEAAVAATRAAPVRRPSSLRLTTRGRIVVTALVAMALVLVVGVGLVVAGGTASAGGRGRPIPVTHHVVLPGETLWGIARSLDPAGDPRDVISQIVELNRLSSAEVPAGLDLTLPAL